MLKIGLTGGIGSGKTAVSDLFHKLGIHIIDTDFIAHQLISNNQKVSKEITAAFGSDIFDKKGNIDRKKLANTVFHSKQNKQLLEKILHPRIRDEVNLQVQRFSSYANPPQYIIIVIPLLLETDFRELVDRILVVISDEKIRIERVKQRDGRSIDEIQAIISSQVRDDQRLSTADDIIYNDRDISTLAARVYQLHEKYTGLSAAHS